MQWQSARHDCNLSTSLFGIRNAQILVKQGTIVESTTAAVKLPVAPHGAFSSDARARSLVFESQV